MLRVCLAGALGWTLLAVSQGFQTLLAFPPHLQEGGSRWVKPRDGESCGMTWECPLWEHGCKEDFPVNVLERDSTASGFLLVPPAPPPKPTLLT